MQTIKLFLDGASLNSIFEWNGCPEIHGFTTNPSLMKKAGVTDYRAFAKELLAKVTEKPVSFEVVSDDFSEMARQAKEIASWGENVYVKIPVSNSTGAPSYELVGALAKAGVRQNVTAVFTLEQVNAVCQQLKGGPPSIVSVFAGRIADSGRDPEPLMRASVELARWADPGIELLWASSREVLNYVQARNTGSHIITMTPDLVKKLKQLDRDLLDFSLDTVCMFKKDAEEAGLTL